MSGRLSGWRLLLMLLVCAPLSALPCAALTCTDADGDGYFFESGCGTPRDCNDASSFIHPGATETCDGFDSDCDGLLDNSASCARACPSAGNGGTRLLVEGIHNPQSTSLAWTGSGFGVVWDDVRNGAREIYFARLDADGHKIGVDVRITNAPGQSTIPQLAWSGSEFGLLWSDERDGNPELYFARLGPTGLKIGGDLRLTSDPSGLSGFGLVWAGSKWGVTWADARSGSYAVYVALISAGGARLSPDLTAIPVAEMPSIAWSGSEFGIACENDGWGEPQAVLVRVDSAAAAVTGWTQVTDPVWSYAQWPSLAWTGSEYAITWYDEPINNPTGMYFARLSAAGGMLSGPRHLGGGYYVQPAAQWLGLEHAAAWRWNSNVQLARVDAAGVPLGGPSAIPRSDWGPMSVRWTGTFFGVATIVFSGPGPLYKLQFSRIGCNCVDFDHDGYSSCEDCNDALNTAWSPLGEATALRFTPPSKTLLSWNAPGVPGGASSPLRYDTLRSVSPYDFQTSVACVETAGTDTSSADPSLPATGSALFYLVRPRNLCAETGFLGLTSDGAERSAGSCP